MSLFGALSASLTALTAQSRAVNVISNNIANLSTTGYKSSSVSFSTLVAGTVGGGVLDKIRQDISTQGAVNSTGIGTDLAVQGSGFFVVKDASGLVKYTRAGSFRPDADGKLVNEAGLILQGWPLDPDGRLPGEAGNVTYTTNSSDADSLVDISTASISGTASPTTGLTAKINLDATEDILQGAGDTISMGNYINSENGTNGASTLILPAYSGTTPQFDIGDTFSIQIGSNAARTYTYGGIEQSVDITDAGGLNVANASAALGLTGQTLTVTVSGTTTTYTYVASNPDATQNEFSSLNDLADLLEDTDGVSARVLSVNSGAEVYLFVASEDVSSVALDFGGTAATSLGLADTTAVAGTFASLGELNDLIQSNLANDGIDSTLTSPSASSTLEIFSVDPREDITFSSNDGGLLYELGLVSADTTTTTTISKAYDPTDSSYNMASGSISADFSRPITIYTSLGGPLNVNLSFVRLVSDSSESLWGVELYAPEVDGDTIIEDGLDGGNLLAYGTISFNGDGTLRSVTGPIAASFDINPTGLAEAVTTTINFGTDDTLDGMTSFASASKATSLTQNGFPTGQLQSLQIDSEGFITAVFDNSLTSRVYKLPIAYFANPNGMLAESGNAYSETTQSGSRNFGQVGDSNVGTIVPGALEVSTAEIGNELTKLIVSQQSYSASTNVLRKVSDLFDELKQL